MEKITSGKELCDIFFEKLLDRKDIDLQVSKLLKDLYYSGDFTREKILQGLESLRRDS